MAQVAAVFFGYTDEVLQRATDPFRRDCLQQKFKFPPSLSEIREALDGVVKTLAALAFVEERESRGFFFKHNTFVNAAGEKYDPAKHRALPQSAFPIAPAD